MRFRPLILSLLLSILTLPTVAAAQSHMRGGGFITDFEGCEYYGWTPGDIVPLTSRIRPAGVGGNDSTLRISIFAGTYAYHLRFNSAVGGLPSERWIDADAVAYVGSSASFNYLPSNSSVTPRVYIYDLPNYLERDNSRVAINGRIENFDYLAGCSAFVSLVLSYTP
ncbi:hypothetical protein LCM17_14230 [Cereibacter sphaeroides]|nr:hypothetical protein [Cereibacter sphaeroides]